METCQARTRDGRLPDVAAVTRGIAALRLGASLRGIEVTAEGEMVERDGQLLLILSGTGETVRLAPLGAKVQWDREKRQAQPAADEERAAYERLRAGAPPGTSVRVIGPFSRSAGMERPRLEVREFLNLSAGK